MTVSAWLERWLPGGSSRRTATTTAAVFVLTALVANWLLPRPTPAAILVRGVLAGCTTAMLAAGLVLVYRSARIVNFAQAAMGGAAAYLFKALVDFIGVPFFLAFPVVVVGAALAGLLINGLFIQRFFTAPRLVLTVVTIVLADFLRNSDRFVNAIPGIGSAARTVRGASGLQASRVKLPFSDFGIQISAITFGFGAAFTLVLTVLALGGLALFLRKSRLGTAVRGAASNADRALSLGINVRQLSAVVWTISGLLSGLALVTFDINGVAASGGSFALIIRPLAAAVLARMSSIPVAVAAAFGLSILEAATTWSFATGPAVDVGLLLVIGFSLLTQRRRWVRSEEGSPSSWEGTKEIRPIPKELTVVAGVRRARVLLISIAIAVATVFPFAMPNAQTNLASLIFIQALVALSLVVLTGWAGQVSLGQFALVGLAAVAGGNLTGSAGLSFWVTLPLVGVGVAGVAALLGLPALRMQGSFLAVSTLAFAAATQAVLFETAAIERFIPTRVYRPSFLSMSFTSERGYYFLCLGFLVLTAFVVARLRRSRPGRVFIALRDNGAGVESFGIPSTRTRLVAFALSGAICGIAGVLFVHHQRALDAGSFDPVVSVEVFIMAMIGGVTSVAGALLGAVYVGVAGFLIGNELFRTIVTSGGLLVLLVVAPGGLAGLAAAARDAGLRIVAMRRQIPVPSLFADADYEAIRTQRAPLVPPVPFRGLEVIPATRRYTGQSELHGQRARRAVVEGVSS